MAEAEASFNLDGITGPVQAGGFPKERAAAAVEHASDDLVLRIVVPGLRILTHVHSGPAEGALAEEVVVGIGHPLQRECREPLAVMEPVEHHGELFVVHPVARERHVNSFCFGVLPKMTFPRLLVHVQDVIRGAERRCPREDTRSCIKRHIANQRRRLHQSP